MASEEITELLRKYIETRKNIKFIAIVDEQGFVVSSYPFKEERIELIETLSAVFSDILHNVIETISEQAPNVASKVLSITLGFERIRIELHPIENFRIIIFEKLD